MYKEDLTLNNLQWLICHKTGDLINYAKMTETISKQMEQMRLEDANSTTKPTTSINAVANKVTHEQQWPRKRPQQNRCRNCNGKYPHERGPTFCPAFQKPVCLLPKVGTLRLCLFQKTKWRRQKNKPPHTPTSSNQSTTSKLHWGPSTRLKQRQWHGICIPYR